MEVRPGCATRGTLQPQQSHHTHNPLCHCSHLAAIVHPASVSSHPLVAHSRPTTPPNPTTTTGSPTSAAGQVFQAAATSGQLFVLPPPIAATLASAQMTTAVAMAYMEAAHAKCLAGFIKLPTIILQLPHLQQIADAGALHDPSAASSSSSAVHAPGTGSKALDCVMDVLAQMYNGVVDEGTHLRLFQGEEGTSSHVSV